MRGLISYLILTFLFAAPAWSQHTHFTTNKYHEHQAKELLFGVGATNMLSDLGGLNKDGSDYSPIDLEFLMTRYAFHIGRRWRFKPRWATKSLLQYGVFQGDDALTTEPYRNYRNIRVKTHLIEISQHLEWIIFNDEHFGKRYKIAGLKGMKNKNNLFYVIGGVSAFMYLPQAVGGPLLRGLRTEGQGLPGGPKQYGWVSLGLPVGIGYKIGIDALWRISFEFTWTKTFTDYFEDVSGEYYDNAAIYEAYGATSAFYADPSSKANPYWTAHGEYRGHKKTKDSYMILNFSIIRNITIKRAKRIKFNYRTKKGPRAKW
jgi:hypothetical protein